MNKSKGAFHGAALGVWDGGKLKVVFIWHLLFSVFFSSLGTSWRGRGIKGRIREFMF